MALRRTVGNLWFNRPLMTNRNMVLGSKAFTWTNKQKQNTVYISWMSSSHHHHQHKSSTCPVQITRIKIPFCLFLDVPVIFCPSFCTHKAALGFIFHNFLHVLAVSKGTGFITVVISVIPCSFLESSLCLWFADSVPSDHSEELNFCFSNLFIWFFTNVKYLVSCKSMSLEEKFTIWNAYFSGMDIIRIISGELYIQNRIKN
jgi:hypothetical protein